MSDSSNPLAGPTDDQPEEVSSTDPKPSKTEGDDGSEWVPEPRPTEGDGPLP